MKKRLIFSVVISIIALTGCCKSSCNVSGAASSANIFLLDVRSAEEYSAGRVEGSVNIPHTKIAASADRLPADRNQQINIYCRSGRRAGFAIETLKQLGYKNLHNLESLENAAKVMQKKIVK